MICMAPEDGGVAVQMDRDRQGPHTTGREMAS